VKKARLEVKVGLSRIRDEEDSIKDNSESLMAALWVVMDALHDIQVDNQQHHDFMIQNIMRPIVELTMATGLAMKEWMQYILAKSAEKERRREGVNRGVGTEEELTVEAEETEEQVVVEAARVWLNKMSRWAEQRSEVVRVQVQGVKQMLTIMPLKLLLFILYYYFFI
jgi:hypothetical protein